MADWGFYGRGAPLAELRKIVGDQRWFFCRVLGRRRIGKTSLLRELAHEDAALRERLLYLQVPDSDERDVSAVFRRQLEESDYPGAVGLAAEVVDFASMARAIGFACRSGMVIVLDEFQYFTRTKMRPFTSFLQAEVDALRIDNLKQGGLLVLGSLHSEMNELLEEKGAPLYGRITHRLEIDHWDFEDLLDVFSSQGIHDPMQWLTLWTFFEGVPKFYHDAYVQDLFQMPPEQFSEELLRRMYLNNSSPLADEADTWFLRELKGKSVSILHFLSEHPGCSHGDLTAALTDPSEPKGLGTSIVRLVKSYGMVDLLLPIFAESKSRNARYYLVDNFLQAWLAVAKPARETARLRPMEKAISLAMPRLQALEGFAFEKLIRKLHVECSRKGLGDFELSRLSLGYWNRIKNSEQSIEIDLVALDEVNKKIRFGSCKRSASAHDSVALTLFQRHADNFLKAKEYHYLQEWTQERVLFAPAFPTAQREVLTTKGFICKDLNDFAALYR